MLLDYSDGVGTCLLVTIETFRDVIYTYLNLPRKHTAGIPIKPKPKPIKPLCIVISGDEAHF